MNRRSWLKVNAALIGSAFLTKKPIAADPVKNLKAATGKVMTVTGPIDPKDMGTVLPHEHVFSIFGRDPVRYPYYDREKLFASVVPYLKKVKQAGCDTIVDCTAAYFGRQPEYLKIFSEKTGMQIVTNTGYYAAAKDRYVPEHAYHESAEQIARRWIWEWEMGIDGTDIRPGFVKTAVDDGPLSPIDRKLIVAAVKTHRKTGLVIQTHAGDNWAAVQEIFRILKSEHVRLDAWIWVHAHHVKEQGQLIDAAKRGAWISIDGINADRAGHVIAQLKALKKAKLLGKAMLSHDGNSYKRDGSRKDYHYVLTKFKPLLRDNGFSDADVHQLMAINPQTAFTIQKRLTNG